MLDSMRTATLPRKLIVQGMTWGIQVLFNARSFWMPMRWAWMFIWERKKEQINAPTGCGVNEQVWPTGQGCPMLLTIGYKNLSGSAPWTCTTTCMGFSHGSDWKCRRDSIITNSELSKAHALHADFLRKVCPMWAPQTHTTTMGSLPNGSKHEAGRVAFKQM